MEAIVIFGSSRSDGNTKKAIQAVLNKRSVEIVDLSKKNINYYDYNNHNKDDDFLAIAQKMVQAKIIIFATPVYWYSMSAQLKTFFDRFSDLITIHKDLGRLLEGKNCFAITSGSDSKVPDGLIEVFQRTADYFDMTFIDCFYYESQKEKYMSLNSQNTAKDFGNKIFR